MTLVQLFGRQRATADEFDGYFRVTNLEPSREFRPTFTPSPADPPQLEYDIGLFARSPNPANPETTLTLCQGIFSRGTFGLVRMFSDVLHRDANEAALAELDSDFGTDRLTAMLDERATFLGQWGLRGARGGSGPSYEELAETEGRPRLRYWLDRLASDHVLEAAVGS